MCCKTARVRSAHLRVQQLDAADGHLSGRRRRLLGHVAAAGAALALGLRLLLVRLLLRCIAILQISLTQAETAILFDTS